MFGQPPSELGFRLKFCRVSKSGASLEQCARQKSRFGWGPEKMAKAEKRTNQIILKAGMTIGASAAEMDDEFLLPCFVSCPAVTQCPDASSSGTVIDGRTGSGKTAILKYIVSTTERPSEIDPFDMSLGYASNSDVLSFLHAIGGDLDLMFQILWRHVLCI
jgi:hypothetical protein